MASSAATAAACASAASSPARSPSASSADTSTSARTASVTRLEIDLGAHAADQLAARVVHGRCRVAVECGEVFIREQRELLQHRDERGFRRARCAVLDLQGNAELGARYARAVNALR